MEAFSKKRHSSLHQSSLNQQAFGGIVPMPDATSKRGMLGRRGTALDAMFAQLTTRAVSRPKLARAAHIAQDVGQLEARDSPVVEIVANHSAMAAMKADGSVVVWGKASDGGEPSAEQCTTLRLGGVTELCATSSAFAAVSSAGAVICWGTLNEPEAPQVAASTSRTRTRDVRPSSKSQLNPWDVAKDVVGLVATSGAFLAISQSSSCVAWGDCRLGGAPDPKTLARLDAGVKSVVASKGAFAVLLWSGSVVAWGSSEHGGDASSVIGKLDGVDELYSSDVAFAALKADGSVVTWGGFRQNHKELLARLDSGGRGFWVANVVSSGPFFAATMVDNTVVTWGRCECSDSDDVEDRCRWCRNSADTDKQLVGGVQKIACTRRACAMLTIKGRVVTWGDAKTGGQPDENTHFLITNTKKPVLQILGTEGAFAALLSTGKVAVWGDSDMGGALSSDQDVSDVKELFRNDLAFVAMKKDGSIFSWGQSRNGGDMGDAAADLPSGVRKVVGSRSSFAAVKDDGSVVAWGYSTTGGCLDKVKAELGPVAASLEEEPVVPQVDQLRTTGSRWHARIAPEHEFQRGREINRLEEAFAKQNVIYERSFLNPATGGRLKNREQLEQRAEEWHEQKEELYMSLHIRAEDQPQSFPAPCEAPLDLVSRRSTFVPALGSRHKDPTPRGPVLNPLAAPSRFGSCTPGQVSRVATPSGVATGGSAASQPPRRRPTAQQRPDLQQRPDPDHILQHQRQNQFQNEHLGSIQSRYLGGRIQPTAQHPAAQQRPDPAAQQRPDPAAQQRPDHVLQLQRQKQSRNEHLGSIQSRYLGGSIQPSDRQHFPQCPDLVVAAAENLDGSAGEPTSSTIAVAAQVFDQLVESCSVPPPEPDDFFMPPLGADSMERLMHIPRAVKRKELDFRRSGKSLDDWEDLSTAATSKLTASASLVSLCPDADEGYEEVAWQIGVLGGTGGLLAGSFVPSKPPFTFYDPPELQLDTSSSSYSTRSSSTWQSTPKVTVMENARLSQAFPAPGAHWLGWEFSKIDGRSAGRGKRVWKGAAAPSPWPVGTKPPSRGPSSRGGLLPELTSYKTLGIPQDSTAQSLAATHASFTETRAQVAISRILEAASQDRTLFPPESKGNRKGLSSWPDGFGAISIGGHACATARRQLIGAGESWLDAGDGSR